MAGKKTRIMYIEQKTEAGAGEARIGRVTFSQTGRTIYYRGKAFQSLAGHGIGANYYELESGAEYWISGPKKNGEDRHWAEPGSVVVDDDVAEEYWKVIRGSDLVRPPCRNGSQSR
jgi:hypothetical protein